MVDDIEEDSLGRYGTVIKNFKEWSTNHACCSFVHELRSFNFEAHNFAKYFFPLSVSHHVWLGMPLDSITIPMNISNQ